MLALQKVAKGVGHIELREVDEPSPQPGWVKIEVKAAAICGTDLHIRHDKFPYYPPVTLGHEFAQAAVQLPSKEEREQEIARGLGNDRLTQQHAEDVELRERLGNTHRIGGLASFLAGQEGDPGGSFHDDSVWWARRAQARRLSMPGAGSTSSSLGSKSFRTTT